MNLEPETVAFIQWLVNQGAAMAIALLVLWRLDVRLAKVESALQSLNTHMAALRRAGG